jgi:hypothetical protein
MLIRPGCQISLPCKQCTVWYVRYHGQGCVYFPFRLEQTCIELRSLNYMVLDTCIHSRVLAQLADTTESISNIQSTLHVIDLSTGHAILLVMIRYACTQYVFRGFCCTYNNLELFGMSLSMAKAFCRIS